MTITNTLEPCDLYAVPLPGRWLLHAPLRRVTALCDEAMLDAVIEPKQGSAASGRLGRLLKALDQAPVCPDTARTGPLQPEFLGLIPTRACNMACRYCGFGSQSCGLPCMSRDLAVQAVDWMAELARLREDRTLGVDFFGGEPMLAGHLVRTVVERAQKQAGRHGLATRFELATNGCFGEADRRFVREHFDHVMVSLDGPPDVQNRHRPMQNGAESSVWVAQTLHALAGGRPKICIRMCATAATVEHLAADIAWVCRTFKPDSIHVEPLRPTTGSAQSELAPPNPFAFVRTLFEAEPIAASAGVRLVHASARVDRILTAFCPLGKDVPIVDPEGHVSACYMLEDDWKAVGLDLHWGRLEPGAGEPLLDAAALVRIRKLACLPEACATCFCRWYCAGGCLVNMHGGGRKIEGNAFCVRTRLQCALALLRVLGRHDLAGQLLADPEAMARLTRRKSDLAVDHREDK